MNISMLRLVQEYAHIVTAHGKSGIDITFHDERLAALIADVRRQAMQEAAKYCDHYDNGDYPADQYDCAKLIRAMAGGGKDALKNLRELEAENAALKRGPVLSEDEMYAIHAGIVLLSPEVSKILRNLLERAKQSAPSSNAHRPKYLDEIAKACPGCMSRGCNGECQESDFDFNN